MTAEQHCVTCRWWESDVMFGPGWEGWGYCRKAESTHGQMVRETMAAAMDYEAWEANLRTRPEFGCVQWQDMSVPWWESEA